MCSLCRKDLGIASAGAAGLKEAPSKCPLAGWDGPSESLKGLGDALIESLKGWKCLFKKKINNPVLQ